MALPSRARSARLLVVALVSVSLVVITIDYREGDRGPLATAGDAALAIITPLQEAVSKVTHPIGNFFSTLVHLPSIRHEDEMLKARVSELEQELAGINVDEDRLHALEALLGLQQSLGGNLRTTAAEVIASGVSNFEWTIEIGKGSNDGIVVDAPVLSPGGLVGHVVRVAPNSAFVQLIVDPNSSVAGRLEVSGTTGLVTGEGAQDMRMGLVETTTEVAAGEQVFTAGYKIPGFAQSLYPPNVLIGTVAHVVQNDAALEKFVTVRPAVDLSSLDVVLVVLPDEGG
jgi:rod shape-determining protein MreC